MGGRGFKPMAGAGGRRTDAAPGADPGGTTAAPPGPRRDAAAALAAAAAVAPTLPPTRIAPPEPTDPVAQLNLKVRLSLLDQLAAAAEREGTTQKAIVCRALAAAGYAVHEDDLHDRSNRRRRRP